MVGYVSAEIRRGDLKNTRVELYRDARRLSLRLQFQCYNSVKVIP
jgi:hypothetical protein